MRVKACLAAYIFCLVGGVSAEPPDLRVGHAFHAFEHLGAWSNQAEAAAASGATIIYASGVGGEGYSGLPSPEAFGERKRSVAEYARKAKAAGIKTVLGYLCATSIVGLDAFDDHWTPEMHAEFGSGPAEWLQQDRQGNPLASWYGGEYRPACMNHPGWRAYEKYMVRQQIETGHDGIFFDNPTTHPKGCYCPHCMRGFGAFLRDKGVDIPDDSVEGLRRLADDRVDDFRMFRCTIARDFFAEMREYARTLNPHAVVTANNSLNASSVLFAQCRSYAYNINEMSKTEDFVVVEDMSSQPRFTDDGKFIEYGPTYKQIHAIIHGKPLVAVTIAEGDYHTPPNLVRLAMAEAAAHGATYMLWSTWPEEQRPRMIAAVRDQYDWLHKHADVLQDAKPRRDAQLFLPFRRWLESETCAVSGIAAELTRENIQYAVISEDDFTLTQLGASRVLVVEDRAVLTEEEERAAAQYERTGGRVISAMAPRWQETLRDAIEPRPTRVKGAPGIRAVVTDTPDACVVHLYNLNVRRVSSFEDEVLPSGPVTLRVTVPFDDRIVGTYSSPGGDVPIFIHVGGLDGPRRMSFTVPEIGVSGMAILRPVE